MTIPTLAEAEEMLSEAGDLNPGPWTDHVRYVADGAERIARLHPELDPERSRILALLHDIGRREGRTDMRHVIDGYNYLRHRGLEDAARICLTHSFPVQDVDAASGEWDCSQEELASVRESINGLEYGDYDRLLQLCDVRTTIRLLPDRKETRRRSSASRDQRDDHSEMEGLSAPREGLQ